MMSTELQIYTKLATTCFV